MKSRLAVRDKSNGGVSLASMFAQHAAVQPVADRFERAGLASVLNEPGLRQEYSQVEVHPESESGAARSEAILSCPVTPTRCPFGGACHTCSVPVSARLAVNPPGYMHRLGEGSAPSQSAQTTSA